MGGPTVIGLLVATGLCARGQHKVGVVPRSHAFEELARAQHEVGAAAAADTWPRGLPQPLGALAGRVAARLSPLACLRVTLAQAGVAGATLVPPEDILPPSS